MNNPLSSLAGLLYIALFKVFLTTFHPIIIVSLIKKKESGNGQRDGQWELQEIGKEYWYVGVRLDDSWRNGCFMIRALFAWWVWLFGLVEWGGEGAARDCQEWRVKWMDLNSRRRDKYCMLCMECEEGVVDSIRREECCWILDLIRMHWWMPMEENEVVWMRIEREWVVCSFNVDMEISGCEEG